MFFCSNYKKPEPILLKNDFSKIVLFNLAITVINLYLLIKKLPYSLDVFYIVSVYFLNKYNKKTPKYLVLFLILIVIGEFIFDGLLYTKLFKNYANYDQLKTVNKILYVGILIMNVLLGSFNKKSTKQYNQEEKLYLLHHYIFVFLVLFSNVFYYTGNFNFFTAFSLMLYMYLLTHIASYFYHEYKKIAPKHFNSKRDENKFINQDEIIAIASKITHFIENEENIKNSNLKLNDISEILEVNKNKISFVINHHFDSNFYEFLAKRRIDFAVKMLDNTPDIKIEWLAYECGFKSKTTFLKWFKYFQKRLPSEHLKMVS